MIENKSYENYPIWIPLLAILVSIVIYVLGSIILIDFGIIIVFLYLVYCLCAEIMVVYRGCKNCYYYGKICGMGKGRIAPIFTKKGDTKIFAERKASFISLIPDFLVSIIPIVGGIILSIVDFSYIRLGLIIVLVIISFGGPAIIRGYFVCKYCKQLEIGCPAQELFSRKKNK